MHFSLHQPPPVLAPWVKTIWCARGTKMEFAAPEPIIPDGCVEMIFNLGDPFMNDGGRQPLDLLAGQMTGPVTALPSGAVDLISVRFWPGRAGAAFRTPMWQLQDRLIAASSVIGGTDRLVDDLRNMPRPLQLDYLAATLAARFGSAEPSARAVVDHALALIEVHRGNVAIEKVAQRVGMTRRHLERKFRDEVGLPAKQMARISRVHAVLDALQHQPLLSGAEIAAQCGYSDQPHMIRECKALTGHTPARLMTSERSLAVRLRAVP